uniref:Ig-like domain-containing protein n=1 Tax=Dicentrarchus labrax TaxID=13489 RepID=A0A8C4GYA2_DICLA
MSYSSQHVALKRAIFIFLFFADPPRVPSVSVRPSGEIVEGSSVNLTCSSDANPGANYTWYKENQTLFQGTEGIHNFTSISSEDRGIYHCSSENQYGQIMSSPLSVDVQCKCNTRSNLLSWWPSSKGHMTCSNSVPGSHLNKRLRTKYMPSIQNETCDILPSVSVSPSGEIVEGSSVTLTCSSDANPAANYTWYKRNGNQYLQPPKGIHHFTSISSEDRGIYHCSSENQYGQIMSSPLSVDVQYAPRVPSVSVSPSGEIVEGSSVTLTCSSDANPAANYTWYKRNGNQYLQPTSKEPQLVFRSIQSSDSGEFNCTAENKLGIMTSNYTSINVKCEGFKPSAIPKTISKVSDAPTHKYPSNIQCGQRLLSCIHHFTSISSEDRGIYHCSSENQYGQIMSSPLSVDVQCKCNTRSNLLSWWPSSKGHMTCSNSVPGSHLNVLCTE